MGMSGTFVTAVAIMAILTGSAEANTTPDPVCTQGKQACDQVFANEVQTSQSLDQYCVFLSELADCYQKIDECEQNYVNSLVTDTYDAAKQQGVDCQIDGDPTTTPQTTEDSQTTTAPQTTKHSQTTTAPQTTTHSQTTTAPQTTEDSQTTTAPQTTTHSQTTTTPQTTEDSQTTTAPQTTKHSQTTTAPQTTTHSQTTTAPQTTTHSQTTTAPQTTKDSQTTTAPQTTKHSQTTTAPQTTKHSQTTTAPQTTKHSQTTTAPQTTKDSQTTTTPQTTTAAAGPICSLSNPSACGGQAETTTEVPETESTTPAGPICSLSNPSACGGQAETTTETPETESTTPAGPICSLSNPSACGGQAETTTEVSETESTTPETATESGPETPAGPICSLSNPSACGGQAETTTDMPKEPTTPAGPICSLSNRSACSQPAETTTQVFKAESTPPGPECEAEIGECVRDFTIKVTSVTSEEQFCQLLKELSGCYLRTEHCDQNLIRNELIPATYRGAAGQGATCVQPTFDSTTSIPPSMSTTDSKPETTPPDCEGEIGICVNSFSQKMAYAASMEDRCRLLDDLIDCYSQMDQCDASFIQNVMIPETYREANRTGIDCEQINGSAESSDHLFPSTTTSKPGTDQQDCEGQIGICINNFSQKMAYVASTEDICRLLVELTDCYSQMDQCDASFVNNFLIPETYKEANRTGIDCDQANVGTTMSHHHLFTSTTTSKPGTDQQECDTQREMCGAAYAKNVENAFSMEDHCRLLAELKDCYREMDQCDPGLVKQMITGLNVEASLAGALCDCGPPLEACVTPYGQKVANTEGQEAHCSLLEELKNCFFHMDRTKCEPIYVTDYLIPYTYQQAKSQGLDCGKPILPTPRQGGTSNETSITTPKTTTDDKDPKNCDDQIISCEEKYHAEAEKIWRTEDHCSLLAKLGNCYLKMDLCDQDHIRHHIIPEAYREARENEELHCDMSDVITHTDCQSEIDMCSADYRRKADSFWSSEDACKYLEEQAHCYMGMDLCDMDHIHNHLIPQSYHEAEEKGYYCDPPDFNKPKEQGECEREIQSCKDDFVAKIPYASYSESCDLVYNFEYCMWNIHTCDHHEDIQETIDDYAGDLLRDCERDHSVSDGQQPLMTQGWPIVLSIAVVTCLVQILTPWQCD